MKLILSVPNLVKLIVPVERNGWVTVQFIHTRSYPGLEGQLYFISSRRNKMFFRHKILKLKPEQKLVVEVLKTIVPTESGECLCYFILPDIDILRTNGKKYSWSVVTVLILLT